MLKKDYYYVERVEKPREMAGVEEVCQKSDPKWDRM